MNYYHVISEWQIEEGLIVAIQEDLPFCCFCFIYLQFGSYKVNVYTFLL